VAKPLDVTPALQPVTYGVRPSGLQGERVGLVKSFAGTARTAGGSTSPMTSGSRP